MMKYVILAVVLAVALGRPQEPAPAAEDAQKPNVTIVSSTSENDGKGGFKWSYKTSDGSEAEQEGHTIAPAAGSTDTVQVIQGSYTYTGTDGKTYHLTYVADQNGFQPKGDFLPTPPTDPNNPNAAAAAGAVTEAPAPAARR